MVATTCGNVFDFISLEKGLKCVCVCLFAKECVGWAREMWRSVRKGLQTLTLCSPRWLAEQDKVYELCQQSYFRSIWCRHVTP